MWIALLCVISAVSVQGYNLNTKYPRIFHGKPGEYFGYSVALHRYRNIAKALIGAPRANSSELISVHQPGVLYQCQIYGNLPCVEIELHKKANTSNYQNRLYPFRKDDMWLGVSLDVQFQSTSLGHSPYRNDIVTCGHLWVNLIKHKNHLANGACYTISGDLDPEKVTELIPFRNGTKQFIDYLGIYNYAFGQVGTSAAFSENGQYLLLGAPGYYSWTGTAISYALNPKKNYEDYKAIRPAFPTAGIKTYDSVFASYMGYSVTSGKFYLDKLDYFAAGAPRDGMHYGRVYIYKAMKSGEKQLSVHQKKEGTQFGEYFGAAVLGINLNQDKFTDLLVGAPFYSTNFGGDEGKVYVFKSNGVVLDLFAELHGKSKPYARFGTVIANAGDLNLDGYNDVAIGAPYEDGKGAVYIYHGSKSGVNEQYVQRISAAELNPLLSGFGIQISRGVDIDNNGYPDLLVGSYASSNAVLFRSQPVIRVTATISTSPQQIDTNVTNCNYQNKSVPCLEVRVCFKYVGKRVSQYLNFRHDLSVEYTIQGNSISDRGFFLSKHKLVTIIEKELLVQVRKDLCSTYTLHIRHDIKDKITPIQLLYRYDLLGSKDRFNKTHPVLDPFSPNYITSLVPFQTGCGTDDKCFADLSIEAYIVGHTDNDPLVVGRNSSLSVWIEIYNFKENAYLSELLIYLPHELPVMNADGCSELINPPETRENVSLVCDIGNPLKTDEKVKKQIKLDLTKIPTDKRKFLINLKAETNSIDINPQDNDRDILLEFKTIADIGISGSSSHEQISYNVKSDGKEAVSFNHTYFVKNYGPSPVQTIDIKLYIPILFPVKDKVVDFVTFTGLKTDGEKEVIIPAECNDTFLQMKIALSKETHERDPNFGDNAQVAELRYSDSTTFLSSDNNKDTIETIVPPQFKSNERKSVQERKDVVMDCETAKCLVLECSASPFTELQKFAKITVSMELNFSILNEYLDPWYRIHFVTRGAIFIHEDNSGIIIENHHPHTATVNTTVVNSKPPEAEKVTNWNIFVGIVIGILLLLIILVLLIKFGFFKREQKEKIKRLRSEKDNERNNGHDNESFEKPQDIEENNENE